MRWPPAVYEGGLQEAIRLRNPTSSLSRFTASVTTQPERKPVMSAANTANDAVDADAVNNDKRKSLSTCTAGILQVGLYYGSSDRSKPVSLD